MTFRRPSAVLLLTLVAAGSVSAQAPTGAIAGVVTDSSGAALGEVHIGITNRETGQTRVVVTSAEGRYRVEALTPGTYRVAAEAAGFKRMERPASLEAGTTTTVNLTLQVGDVSETMTVSGAAPLLHYEQHQVGGVVTRDQIDNLPLNGRNFLELAKLEPGVTSPVQLSDNRTFVSLLGAGLQTIPRIGYTRVTVDGVSITTPATIGTLLQVSQDVVQEFQISTVNFDPATSLTSNGAINIVTRSGGNQYRGSGFSFYRDHNLAAYPGLSRDARNPDPFFRRSQFGAFAGGPIRTDRALFFASYERDDQHGVVSVQPAGPVFAPLGGIFPTPSAGNLFSARVDVHASPSHNAFGRYTHDDSGAFASVGAGNLLPSAWTRRSVHVDQSMVALTSVLSPRIVNDVRFSYLVSRNVSGPGNLMDCPGCFGLGAPSITIMNGGVTFGNPATSSSVGRRSQLTDSVVWQAGHHRLRAGVDWEHTTNKVSVIDRDPAQLTLWSPSQVRQLDPTIPLPASFTTLNDFLQLPLRSFETAVGPGGIPQRNFEPNRVQDLYRLYASDTWEIGSRMTVNAGLSWSYEPNALNYDLTKPALLVPILGAGGLGPPAVQAANFSPTLGFAWTATRDARTVVRGGAGRYFDPVASSNAVNLDNERLALSPLGTGRLIVSGSNILSNGRPLDFQQPTPFTGAQLLALLPDIRAALLQSINPDNRDFSVRNLDLTKQASNLYDPAYVTPYAVHVGLGVQRELAPGLVVSADVVWKQFVHTFINGIDYNRFNSVEGPVILACTATQQRDVHAVCSNGSIFFDTTIGRARYKGLLVRVEKRFGGRAQLLASYALSSFVGSNGTGTGTSEASGGRVFGFDNNDWSENYGPLPTDQRHVLNVSGFVELPWRLQAAFTISASTRPPFSPYVAGMDFNGDGTVNDLLPGTTVNQFNRGLDRNDLVRLTDNYNQQYAGRLTAGGQIAPRVTLPTNYSLDDSFVTADLRLTRTFPLHERARLLAFGEVFNLFNTANLVQYGANLADTATFGQPSARFTQVFGSGGPRAFQFGARVSF
jgi:Carboxypeptidase regulatory-like domain